MSTLKAANNTGTLSGEIARTVKALKVKNIIVTEPGEYRLKKMIDNLPEALGVKVDVRDDDRFLCRLEEFKVWASDKKQLRIEFSYHEMRKRYKILIAPDGKPMGGQWNYDTENRKPPINGLTSPKRMSHPKPTILKQVFKLVGKTFSTYFENLEPFHYAITRQEALSELHHFIKRILPDLGDYQDAMVKGEAYLNHSLLSSYLNAGLLLPLEV